MKIVFRAMILMACLLGIGGVSAASDPGIVGQKAPIFKLVSHQGRLVSYQDDYYGRHHLILTFFPAAFTPV